MVMEKNFFDQTLKNALQEKAPAGFTDSIMDKLVVEQGAQEVISSVWMPGKGFIGIMFGLFGLAIAATFYFNGPVGSGNSMFNYFYTLVSKVHFQIGPSVKLLVLSIAAICGFLVLDYIFRLRKIVSI